MLFWIFGVIAIVFAIFLAGDADLPLLVLPFDEKNGFKDKIIWITGASSGIGASLAIDLTRAGAQVIISARRVAQLESVADQCSQVGKKPMVLPLDVTDLSNQAKAVQTIHDAFGRIDSIVLNAGRSQRSLAVDTSIQDTKALFDLNFFSVVSLAKLVLPRMIERKAGQIVVVSSLSGRLGTPIGSSYSGTKFALHGYFEALRAEVSMHNISVSLVCPGPVESEISEHTLRNPALPKQDEGKKMPTHRCTSLIAKGMYYRFEEFWISGQPFLLTTYVNQYMPWVSRKLMTKVIGPSRVRIVQSGGNVYDLKALFGFSTTEKTK